MKVAITRPKERSESTIREVEERGWEALIVPAIEIVPVDYDTVKSQVGNLADYDWMVLTSAAGADIVYDIFGHELNNIKIGVIGPKTSLALEERGIKVDLIPREYKGENLADEMVEAGISGQKILVARASIGREVLVNELEKVALVKEVTLYDTDMPRDLGALREMELAVAEKKIDAVIFTSSQTVKNIFSRAEKNLAENLKNVKVCAIGPITKTTLEEFGVRVDIMPEEYTVKASLDALESPKGE